MKLLVTCHSHSAVSLKPIQFNRMHYTGSFFHLLKLGYYDFWRDEMPSNQWQTSRIYKESKSPFVYAFSLRHESFSFLTVVNKTRRNKTTFGTHMHICTHMHTYSQNKSENFGRIGRYRQIWIVNAELHLTQKDLSTDIWYETSDSL